MFSAVLKGGKVIGSAAVVNNDAEAKIIKFNMRMMATPLLLL
jgi:hypothetical protein